MTALHAAGIVVLILAGIAAVGTGLAWLAGMFNPMFTLGTAPWHITPAHWEMEHRLRHGEAPRRRCPLCTDQRASAA